MKGKLILTRIFKWLGGGPISTCILRKISKWLRGRVHVHASI